jgi:exodeoxyribonuclease V gamma subunit
MRIHRSNRSEELLAELVRILADRRLDPLAPECIVVQGRGMERWLELELSNRLGAFANAEFPFPRAFLQRSLAAVLGEDPGRGREFDPEALMWSIVEKLPALKEDPRFGSIREYLREDASGDQLLGLSRRIADHFDHYVIYRPEMVLAWERGERPPGPDLPEGEAAWQAELWRRLVEQHGSTHLAARIARFIEEVAGNSSSAAESGPKLPSRVCVFGVSTLPPLFMAALAALGEATELHLFIHSPSRQYWGQIRSAREQIRDRWREHSHAEDDAAFLHFEEGHPLLASLGRLGRDFQEILESGIEYEEGNADLYRDPLEVDPDRASLLRALQSDILNLRDRSADVDAERWQVSGGDRSLSLHACHGPMREAEVLRDQLLDLFEADASLRSCDVVVMTPDVETYAPFVEAVFSGGIEGEAGRGSIPCRVSDRGARSGFEVVEAFSQLLDVLGGRLTASELLDLLGQPCIRSRFGILESDQPRLRDWVEGAGIRWGIDAEHRAREGQPAELQNTWRFGMERLLLGYGMADRVGRLHADVRPFGEIEGVEAQSLGRLADFLARIFDFHDRARERRSPGDWELLLNELLERMVDADRENFHQRQWIRDGLRNCVEAARSAGFSGRISLRGLRDQLDPTIAQRSPPGGFLSGGVTFCEWTPLRTIPFRVVCLMGLGELQFPRSRRRLGFDLIGHAPRPGDRSAREDDRYLFLEALLSARDHLVITYPGFGERDHEVHNPSVVIGELLDHLDRIAIPETRSEAGAAASWSREKGVGVLIEHPLQSFSPAYFTAALGDPRLFSFSPMARDAARLLDSPPESSPPFFPDPLAAIPAAEIDGPPRLELDQLVDFFAGPVKYLMRQRLGVHLFEERDPTPSREPMDLVGLEKWKIGDQLIHESSGGRGADLVEARIRGLGRLPLGSAGFCAYEVVAQEVEDLLGLAGALRAGAAKPPLALDCELSGMRLVGSLAGVWPGGRVDLRFSTLGGSWELGQWIRHLAFCLLAEDGRAPEGVTPESHLFGRPDGGKGTSHIVFDFVAGAREELSQLIEIYRRGQQHPLPFFPRTSRKYAKTLRDSTTADPERHASLEAYRAWRGREDRAGRGGGGKHWERGQAPGESEDPYLRRVFADQDPLANSWRPVPGEEGDGFRFLAHRVFDALLEHRREIR